MECLGQYDPALVHAERSGLLDDPSYLTGLDDNNPLRRNENVFPFSAAAAASETLHLLSAVIAPGGVADVGAHLYHFTTGTLDRITNGCRPGCPYTTLLTATGDTHGLTVTGDHAAATRARQNRRQISRRLTVRYGRLVDDLLWRFR